MYQSLVSFDYWTLIAQLCNFGIQLFLFKRFLFEPVRKILEKRQQEVDIVFADAEQANIAAQEAKESYESHLANARIEAEEITAKAVANAKLQSEQILSLAKEESDKLRAKTTADIELERQRAMSEAKGEISKMAVEIASKLVEKEIDESAHAALIDKFIDEIGEN